VKGRREARLEEKIEANLGLAEFGQYRVDRLECCIDLLTYFRSCQNNLAANKDEQDDLWFDHAVDETGEQLRFVRAEMSMGVSKTLESNGKLDIAGADDVLNLELLEFGFEPKLLNDPRIFAASQSGVVFRLGPSYYHLARSKDQSCGLRFPDSHDNGCETLRVVLGVPSMKSNSLKVETTIEVDGSYDILEGRQNPIHNPTLSIEHDPSHGGVDGGRGLIHGHRGLGNVVLTLEHETVMGCRSTRARVMVAVHGGRREGRVG